METNLVDRHSREDGCESRGESDMKKNREASGTWAKSLFPCTHVFHPLSAQGGWQSAERLRHRSQITSCHQRVRGASRLGPLERSQSWASRPSLSSMAPAWMCYTSSIWIYSPINGESLCIIKSWTDLSGIQFNNYLSNSIIFRYVVSVSVDLEDLPGQTRQHFLLLCY